jgi:hypothetical protein
MSGFGRIVGGVLGAAALAFVPAVPAQAAQGGVFVQVNPNTIQAGYQVGIHASCGEDLNPARVRSRAFGEVTLNPYPGSGYLSGSATVPSDTRAGEYDVDLRCANGSRATTELFVLGMARPTRGPSTGGGGTAVVRPGQPRGRSAPLPQGTAATAVDRPPDRFPPVLIGGAVAVVAGVGLLVARRRAT